MTLREALAAGRKALAAHRCGDSHPDRETELFLEKASGLSREAILASPEKRLTSAQAGLFRSCLRRRLRHEPTAYIVGTAWFRGREFLVSPATLVPRPATESLAETAVAVIARHPGMTVIDVGTGSGCIALALAAETAAARIIGLDASPAALKVAKKNTGRAGTAGRIAFRRSDLLSGLKKTDLPRNGAVLVVANLPYLPSAMIPGLEPEVRDHEPAAALDGGADGLDLCRRLVEQAAVRLPSADLHLVLEILPRQYRPLLAFAQKKFPGLRAEKIFNLSGTCVGASLASGCAAA